MGVRLWLRRVMPRVAVAAGLLLFLWLLFGDTALYRQAAAGSFLRYLTLCVVLLTCIYYGLTALRWLKRKLLWRVRRRLVITYLFIGLTPIILMTLLGLISAFGGSGQGMARIITAQVNATERQTIAAARGLAEAFKSLPPVTDDRAVQSWLDESASLLHASLPGARVALWRGANGAEANAVGHTSAAQFVSTPDDERARGVGDDSMPADAALPEWLRGRAEWGGLAFAPAASAEENFGSPSMRAVVRGTAAGDRPFTLLLTVPVSRALIEHYRDATGIYVRPFFVSAPMNESNRIVVRANPRDRRALEELERQRREAGDYETRVEEMFRRDQFGEQPAGTFYLVVLPATEWKSGQTSNHLSFLFDWSWALAGKQFWGGSEPGEMWRQALKYIAIVFLLLELLALTAAAWMTRAVTGTVHKLYRAVEYIKRGDFSHRVRVRSHDQLGELAAAFNDMSANIEALLEERVERERLEREIEIAHEVQAQLFPRRTPELLTAEITGECRAALGVAGDYYDYIEVAPGLVALALGDVSGKGVSASLVMSNLQASLRAQTSITAERMEMAERALVAAGAAAEAGGDHNPAHASAVRAAEIDGAVARKMTNINRQLCQSTESNRFATLFLALYEDRTRRLRYTNAGHNAPLLIRADGAIERLTVGGMMAGAFEWAEYEEDAAALAPGDVLLIYSDGISEAENEEGCEYGEERLARFAVAHRESSPDELRQAIFTEIDAWSGKKERNDDQTLVILKAK
ncbi:MAG TPA: SpoIIE family protein phosphatase [Pyrinomonadaceae bacterium]|nr:SpoIIE family protein phosphatase [Pyrinomonadaceae bacterium]